ncbi:MAG: DUF1592 domain-containing protein [Myxococcota bacterium]
MSQYSSHLCMMFGVMCVAGLAACTGSIEGTTPQTTASTTPTPGETSAAPDTSGGGATTVSNNGITGGTSGGGMTTGMTTPGTTTTPDEPGDPTVCVVEETPLRRLSHFEYRNTMADLFPNVDLPDLSLPADDRPHEFDNDADGMSPSSSLIERYVEIGRNVVEALGRERLMERVTCQPADGSPAEAQRCGREFVQTEGQRIFRRPLTDDQVERYSALFTADIDGATFEDRVALTLQVLLAAPEFLYRFEGPTASAEGAEPGTSVPLDPYALASRLSYFMWGTMPDDALMAAANDGSILDPEVLRTHAERLVNDDRARNVFTHFHAQWLDFDHIYDVTKRSDDGLDNDLRASIVAQGEVFVDQVLFEDRGTVNDLLTSDRTFYDANLAPLYGAEPPAEGWSEATFANREGLLTQPAFLASHGHPDKPSPVLRGAFVLERIMCIEMGAPPPNAEAEGNARADELEGPLTNRQVYELITSEPNCASCHESINPVGAAFEVYDTMGRYRTQEPNGLDIDSSAELGSLTFDDAVDLARQLAVNESVEACVVKKWLRYAYAGGPAEKSPCYVDTIRNRYQAEGGTLRDVQLAIVTHPAFATLTIPVVEPEEEAP